MSTVIINGIEYVPAKTVTGTRAAAEPVDVRHLDPSFRFDPDAQQHIPTLLVEFEPVSAVGGGDPKAKGWRDRDLLAMMLRGQPTAHIALAEQAQADEALTRRMAAIEAEIRAHNDAVAAWNERAALAAEQPQPEAVATLHDDGYWTWKRGEPSPAGAEPVQVAPAPDAKGDALDAPAKPYPNAGRHPCGRTYCMRDDCHDLGCQNPNGEKR